jgi:hypothetical protein
MECKNNRTGCPSTCQDVKSLVIWRTPYLLSNRLGKLTDVEKGIADINLKKSAPFLDESLPRLFYHEQLVTFSFKTRFLMC